MTSERNSGQPGQAPDCWKCQHHYITYDPSFPYGCQAMNFKSRRPPSREVFEASGTHCLMFRMKIE